MGEESSCRLLGGVLAFSLQGILALLAFSSLVIKRAREHPPLELRVWVLNVSKQVVSLTAAHAFAIIASIFLSLTVHGASQCSWYVVIFSVDTIVGTALTVFLHQLVIRTAEACLHQNKETMPARLRWMCEVVVQCGYYGNPPSIRVWALQAVEWTLCVLLARFLCAVLVTLLGPSVLAAIAAGVDGLFGARGDLQLASVMILWPLLVNTVQALFQDAILRGKRFQVMGRLGSMTSREP